MFTNLLIAFVFVTTSFIVILNFSRLVAFAGATAVQFNRIRLLMGTLVRAYRRYNRLVNKPHLLLNP